MTVTRIISAIGNNSSVYPLIFRDCGVEIPSKVYLTYQENKDDKEVAFLATREKIVDEYATSAVWLGGIPFVEWIANKFIKKSGFNPAVNLKLFKESNCQGIDFNIKTYEEKLAKNIFNEAQAREVKSALEDIKKVKLNKGKYEKLLSGKFLAATTIPIALMGFVIPKLVFGMTAKTKAAKKAKEDAFIKNENNTPFQKQVKPTFTGNFSSTVAGFSTYQKMATIDGGYAVGRVATARKKNEAVDIAFKMIGMMFLNFVAPKYIEKILDSVTSKVLNLNVKLDPIMLADEKFIKAISTKKIQHPEGNVGKALLKFIDENPDSIFTQYATKFEKVKMLKSGVRDPRAFVDVDDLGRFKKSIEDFSAKALSVSGDKNLAEQVQRFAKKAKMVKSLNILANVGLSSFLLAYALPKVQYAFREWYTGSKLEPGIVDDPKKIV